MPIDTLVQPRDVIFVHVDDKPAFFARVEEIRMDGKKGWRQLRFTILAVPLQETTWILEPSQIDGEPFTMGGMPLRIERLPDPRPTAPPPEEDAPGPGRVIAFPPRPGR